MASTALVTGAAGGLGGAVVRRLRADGWRVVAPVRRPTEFGDDGVHAVIADLTEESAVATAVAVAGDDPTAPLRAVVNLAGGFASGGRVHETPVAEFEAMLALNLRSAYLVTGAALPRLVTAGGGAVVCVGSRAARRPFSGAAGYITAKAALAAFVESVAVEYRDDGVRANLVVPSVIDTPGNRAAQPTADHSRWVAPEQIADVIAFLCSDSAAAVSGARVPVYGRA